MRILVLLAFIFWGLMFSPLTKGLLPFWPMMMLASGLLAAGAFLIDRRRMAEQLRFRWIDLPIGIVSAGVLYGLFFLGHALLTALLPFAGGQIESIYAIRSETPHWLIALMLFLWVGPAEEIFWRGFVQDRLTAKHNPYVALLLAAALYTLVHAVSFNPMLIAAAGLCGLFWGLLYFTTNRLWPVILSHALWDVLIFIVLPIQGSPLT